MANEVLETVMVKVKGGGTDPVQINKSDFNDELHTLHTGKEANAENDKVTATAQTAPTLAEGLTMPVAPSAVQFHTPENTAGAPTTPSPNQKLVTKKGTKFVVVDGAGNQIEDERLDAKGYKTEQEAWTAALALDNSIAALTTPALPPIANTHTGVVDTSNEGGNGTS